LQWFWKMEKIHTKQELLELIKDFKAVEVTARKGYEEDLVTFKNFEILDILKVIKAEEDKHIMILDELIDLLG